MRHLDMVRVDKSGRSGEQLDTLAGEQLGGVRAQMLLDVLDARGERVDIDLGALLLEAHAAESTGEAHRPAGGDHRLRGDAVPQVRCAADDIALDERHLGAEARRMGGSRIAGGAAADDDQSCRHGPQATAGAPIRG
jgi:hypothetical protein